MKRVLLYFACAVAAGVIAAGGAQAQPVSKPLMLVASPELQGAYGRTTLIAVPAGEQHIGFILNRATELKLSTLFPEHAPSAKVVDPVHFGGPEMVDALFAVVRRNPGADAVPLFGGLYLVADAQAVERVIDKLAGDARFFAGFVGWHPGELAKEIEAGYWYVTDPDAALFFRPDTTRLWEELIERLGNGHAAQRGFRTAGL
jgi:putative transcriptional regulator